jgi:hypothetical protein
MSDDAGSDSVDSPICACGSFMFMPLFHADAGDGESVLSLEDDDPEMLASIKGKLRNETSG